MDREQQDNQQHRQRNVLERMYPSRKEIILSRSLAETSMKKQTEIKNPTVEIHDSVHVMSDEDDDGHHDDKDNNEHNNVGGFLTKRLNNFDIENNCHHPRNDEEIIHRSHKELLTVGMNNFGSSESDENYYRITPPKKRKIYNLNQKNFENNAKYPKNYLNQTENTKDFVDCEFGGMIDFESESLHNKNILLKTDSESSSDFIVSSSSKNIQPRSRLKNTIPIDSFERCLTYISKKYPEMTYKERISIWDFSRDVDDVEDYTDFERRLRGNTEFFTSQKYKKIKIQHRYNTCSAGSSGLNNINNNKISIECKIDDSMPFSMNKNNHNGCNKSLNPIKIKPSETGCVTATNCNASKSKFIINEENHNNLNKDDEDYVLMSINTKTMKSYKNEKVFGSNNESYDRNNLNPVWSDSENLVVRKNINPEIDKISRIIQSRATYKQNTENNHKMKICNNGDLKINQEQFKIPNIPTKYGHGGPQTLNVAKSITATTTSSSSPLSLPIANNIDIGSAQQEEFCKYLGLGTNSPNNKSNDSETNSKRDKKSPGRVTRLQLEKFSKRRFDDHVCHEKFINGQENKSMKNYNNNKLQNNLKNCDLSLSDEESKIKIVFSQSYNNNTSLPLKIKPRRSCGCIINSEGGNVLLNNSGINKMDKSSTDSNSMIEMEKMNSRKSRSTLSRKSSKSSTTESVESSAGLGSMILMRHSYKYETSSNDNHQDQSRTFFHDFSKIAPPKSTVTNDISRNKTLVLEAKTHSIAADLYKKFLEMLEEDKLKNGYRISIQQRNFDQITDVIKSEIEEIKDEDSEEEEEEEEEELMVLITSPNIENEISQSSYTFKANQSFELENTFPKSNEVMLLEHGSPLNDVLNSNLNVTCSVLPQKSDNYELLPQSSFDENVGGCSSDSINVVAITNAKEDQSVGEMENVVNTVEVVKENLINVIPQNRRSNKKAINLHSLKVYRKILKDKRFIKFLKRNRSKIIRKIGGFRIRKELKLKDEVEENFDCLVQLENEEEDNGQDELLTIVKHQEEQIDEESQTDMNDVNVIETEKLENDVSGDDKFELSTIKMPSLEVKTLANPLDPINGNVLHIYYEQDLLIVVQEHLISFWKYSKITQMMGKTQEWTLLGDYTRKLHGEEVSTPYKNRLCISDTNPVYIEVRGRQFSEDKARDCNMASIYVNVYHYNEWKTSVLMYSVQLDTIRGLIKDINYTSIINSRYFILCWKQELASKSDRTGICKYALTPDLDTLASIRDFKSMKHVINQLDCINDEKLIGFGQTQVTIWNHRTGDILTNFDLEISLGRNLGSVLTSLDFENYLFLYQLRQPNKNEESGEGSCSTVTKRNTTGTGAEDNNLNQRKQQNVPELKIIALTLTHLHPNFRLIHSHELPSSFSDIKSSICTENYLITTSTNEEEFLLLPNQPERLFFVNQDNGHFSGNKNSNDLLSTSSPLRNVNNSYCKSNVKRFYTTGNENFIEITDNSLFVKTIHHYLLNFIK